jgi:hypothetical protein
MIPIICAALSGLGFYFSIGLGEQWWLAWLAPIPVLWLAFEDTKGWTAFLVMDRVRTGREQHHPRIRRNTAGLRARTGNLRACTALCHGRHGRASSLSRMGTRHRHDQLCRELDCPRLSAVVQFRWRHGVDARSRRSARLS